MRYVMQENNVLFIGLLRGLHNGVDFKQDGLTLGPNVTREDPSLTTDNVKHSGRFFKL